MKISYEVRIDSAGANREALRQRRDYTEELLLAFEELVAIAQEQEA